MKVTLWGTRGSLASPGPDTVRYGGNTSCVSVQGDDGTILILDAGTGIRVLGQSLPPEFKCVNILLTHLHMDHVQGLPFFAPLRFPGAEVHIWGPASSVNKLESRLLRYLSPPLFPVRARDLLTQLHFHELTTSFFGVGEFMIHSQMIMHPNPTVGYRIQDRRSSMAYLPDHEPAIGASSFPVTSDWTSGYDLAEGVDLLVHDSQYSPEEYSDRVGFGHSNIEHAMRFADQTQVKEFVPFHHDPAHSDDMLDRMISESIAKVRPQCVVMPGVEGAVFTL
jgi:phosphoribosyl 1,2-cyclic phosphodiesterase